MEKTSKIIVAVIVFGFVLPCTATLYFVGQQEKQAKDLQGIRDYKAGHYDAAIQELGPYTKAHPMSAEHSQLAGKADYAEYYLGQALLRQHRYTEAVSVFRVYAQYSAGNDGKYLLGVALFRNGDRGEAKAKFQEVIDSEMRNSYSARDQGLVRRSYEWIEKINHPTG